MGEAIQPTAEVVDGDPIVLAEELGAVGLRELSRIRRHPPFESESWGKAWGLLEAAERRLADAGDRGRPPHEVTASRAIVVGDLHGDVATLWAARRWRDERMPDAELVLLGDLVDRGPCNASAACIALLWGLKPGLPGVTVLAGNHDVAMRRDPRSGAPDSGIHPSEFAAWLSGCREPGLGERLLEFFRAAVARLPRWTILPGGLLAVHASVPHVDVLESIESIDDLESHEVAARDLVWLRLAADVPRKSPNRRTSGCEIGIEDVAAGLDRIGRLVAPPGEQPAIRGLIRGHDHVGGRRHVCWTSDRRPIVTLNSMSFELPEDALEPQPTRPFVAIVEATGAAMCRPVVTLRPLVLPAGEAAEGAGARDK